MAGQINQAKFVEGGLFRHITVMSLTSSVGLMAIFIVDLINMLYISWLKDPVLTAAVGYAGVVLFLASAFGIGLSIGVSALVAQAVGAHDMEQARRRSTNGLLLALAFGVIFVLVLFPFLGAVISGLGAEGRTAGETLLFLRLTLLGQPLLMLGMTGAAILRAFGEARRAMMVTVWAAVVLAILDPILILWAGWELTGAAVAGFGSRLVMVYMAVAPVWRRIGGFSPVTLAGLREALPPLFSISGPAILTQLATPVGQAFVTRMVAGYGEAAVAGMAIVGRLTPVAFAVLFALAGAIGPIIGQNLGARRMDRVRRASRDAVVFTALVILIVSAVLFLLRAPIADLFHAEAEMRSLIYLFCGPLSLLFFFNGLIFLSNAMCNNLGAAMQSTMINWARHTLGTVPFALLGAKYGQAEGVLIGQSVGGVIFGLLAIWLAMRVIDRHPLSRAEAATA